MLLKFNPELTEQEIYANGDELAMLMGKDKDESGKRVYNHHKDKIQYIATIKDPVLITDNHKIANITDYIKRETVFALYNKEIRITEYDGLKMEFEQKKYPGVRGPSIDTLLFTKALRDIDLDDTKTAIEVGSGPGFIAKYIARKSQNLEKMSLVDINPNAKQYFDDHTNDKRFEFHLGDAKEFLNDKTYDLVVCNPPYIPRPESIDDNPYEGLSLPIYLIENIRKILNPGGKLMLNISSLSEDIMNDVLDQSNLTITKLESLDVPLKVFNVLNNLEWMNYLLEEKGLKEDYHAGHKYRQTLNIVEITV